MALKDLINWSQKEFAYLPWRKRRTLYLTLVSEIMLQQTTVGTVLNHFERFLEQYPTIDSLAESTEEDLTIAWKGLGYYRRARNLLKACRFIVDENNSKFPKEFDQLLEIPGVGEYTASALISIGRNQSSIAVDANIERVVARLYDLKTPKGPKLMKEVRELFQEKKVLQGWEKFGARDLNEALMDLGRGYCQARKAYCLSCPMSDVCISLKRGTVNKVPVVLEKKKKAKPLELKLLRIICKEKGKLFVVKKKKGEWLAGQYEIPTFIVETEDKTLSQYPLLKKKSLFSKNLVKYKTGITKYKIENSVLVLKLSEFKKHFPKIEGEWLEGELEKQNLSTATYKALAAK